MIEHRDLAYWEKEIQKYSSKIDKIFLICRDRIELSEELLEGLRNFIESVQCYIYKKYNNKTYENRYEEIQNANRYCKRTSSLNFLSKFMDNLNASVGHQTFIGEYAERLSLKYVSSLIKVKNYLLRSFNIKVLTQLSLFPFDMDDSFLKYYKEILKVLRKQDLFAENGEKGTYYIQKKKMLYVDNTIFYEYVLTSALDNNSKYDRFIAFSLIDIPINYAISASSVKMEILFFNQNISYLAITGYEIAIRPCEIEKLVNIVSDSYKKYSNKSGDYYRLMNYLKNENTNLAELMIKDENEYLLFSKKVFEDKKTIIYETFDRTRKIISDKQTGFKTLLYLLYRMNNDILKKQIAINKEDSLSNINLKKGVYSFEKAAFSSGLINHMPPFDDLINIFDYEEHKHEILARSVMKLSNELSCIYIPNEMISSNNLAATIDKYNSTFNKVNLMPRKIAQFGKYTFISENEIETLNVLNCLIKYSNKINFDSYSVFAECKIKEIDLKIDDIIKEEALKKLFEKSSIFAVYGAAGTGKSYFARYVLKVLNDLDKVCIASTNPAVENMKRKFEDQSAEYMTITKFLNKYDHTSKIDLLIIDECSTISTKEINEILSKTSPKLILLLGDIYQIQSITFGNWFAILQKFIPNRCFVDLKSQFRTESETLIGFWNEVRKLGPNIQEKLAINEISSEFNDSLFKKNYDDEIILCLNYDGLYGINNLNKVLQNANPNKATIWKQYIFKKGDPIIFNDSIKYKDLFYNNLKGVIFDVNDSDTLLIFTIVVNKVLNPIVCKEAGVDVLSINDQKTTIELKYRKYSEDIYDRDTENSNCFPFQVAYALSIHKAQGLEYDSVKIIISNEVEENITHNIFYTAITRAKKYLTIYWTPETEKKIVDSFNLVNYDNDANLLKERRKILNNE